MQGLQKGTTRTKYHRKVATPRVLYHVWFHPSGVWTLSSSVYPEYNMQSIKLSYG
jgi:hypothetical protein